MTRLLVNGFIHSGPDHDPLKKCDVFINGVQNRLFFLLKGKEKVSEGELEKLHYQRLVMLMLESWAMD
jgi:hypothetical protein